jgi:hypothetical protein
LVTSGIPSVVILIAVGLVGKPVLAPFGLALDGIDAAVPVIGTVGLVLIVLEGALDIPVNSDGTTSGVIRGLIGGGLLSLLLAVVCAAGLALILMRISGHIRFIPLLAGLFGLYAAGELMHLSPLIMVLLFGLVLNNSALITVFYPFRRWLDDSYETTLNDFKLLTMEFDLRRARLFSFCSVTGRTCPIWNPEKPGWRRHWCWW